MKAEHVKKVEKANELALQIKNLEFHIGKSNDIQNFLLTLLTKYPDRAYGTDLKIQFDLDRGSKTLFGFIPDSNLIKSIHQAYQKHIDKLIGELAALEKELEDL
jgi:hypothetical protein